jgi:hypothetical protein
MAGPTTGTTSATAVSTTGAGIGDCTVDQFSISGTPGTPVICGFNTGQHMIVDAVDSCHTVSAFVGADATTSREWDITVSQYACGDEDSMGGPPGCLQYHTADTGKISSFNFPTADAMIGDTATHLSNQRYSVCVRRNANKCYICYIPTPAIAPASATNQDSFGLSVSPDAAPQAGVNTECSTDYITIPAGTTLAIAMIATDTPLTAAGLVQRACGRFFAIAAGTASVSLCTRSAPFRLGVNLDSDEVEIAADVAISNESAMFPGGIVGFGLNYAQKDCP